MFHRVLYIIVCCVAVVCRGEVPDGVALRLEEGEVLFRTRVRMVAEAARTEMFQNPLSNPHIDWLIPDGALVSSGQVLVAFSPEEVGHQLADRRLEEGILTADIHKEATAEGDQELTREDELAGLLDQRAVLEAQLARLRALPEPGQVRIAEGQLRVATLEADAASRELARSRDRLARGMISEAELRGSEFDFKEREAALERAGLVLAFRRKPVKEVDLQEVGLQLENVDLDIKRKRHEISQNREILKIKRRGSAARRTIVRKRILEAEEAVGKLKLMAPQDGYVTYTQTFRSRYLQGGRKMHRNYPFLTMPDHTQLVLKGSIQENDRQFLEVGDVAMVVASVHEGEAYGGAGVVTGRVSEISMLSRDQAEKNERGWGGEKNSGVKVYDVSVEMDEIPAWLRIGMHAEVELIAAEAQKGVSVPAGYVSVRDDGFHLGLDGVLTPVEGILVGDQFLVRGSNLVGRTVSLFARPRDTAGDVVEPLPGLRVMGELVPTDTTAIRVGDIHRWQKVAWLIPENSQVAAGDLLVKLDDEETVEVLSKRRSHLEERQSTVRRQEEEDELTGKLDGWALEKARNTAELRRLQWVEQRDGRDELGIVSATYQLRRSEIHLARLKSEYARSEAKGHRLLSPVAKRKLERDLERAQLSLESAGIDLDVKERGPLPTELRREELRYVDGLRDAEDMSRRQAFNAFRRDRSLARARLLETRAQRDLDRMLRAQENLEMYAPRAGIVRYGKVWDGSRISKIKEGVTVGERFRLMEVAEVEGMEVRVGVSERFFGHMKKGLKVDVLIPSMEGVALSGTVSTVEFLFEDKRRKDTAGGIYAIQEHLGETEFFVRVGVTPHAGISLKPGTMAEVIFPFNGEVGQ